MSEELNKIIANLMEMRKGELQGIMMMANSDDTMFEDCISRLKALAVSPEARPAVGERAVSFHEWWDAQNDELFIVPSHAIKGWAWKAWNAALDMSNRPQQAKE